MIKMFSPKEVKLIDEETKKLDKGWSVRINRNMQCISFHITKINLEKIDNMVKNGRFINRSEALRAAINEYITNHKNGIGI